MRQTLEENAGAQNEGVRLALYFQRKAEASKSAYEILADPALLKVVQTALGIPPETGTQDIDRQAALISAGWTSRISRIPRSSKSFSRASPASGS